MKSRQGFVSNSSSSSFIVAFPKSVDEMTVEDLRVYMYGDVKEIQREWEDDGVVWKTVDIAGAVYNDAKNQNPYTNLFDDTQEKALIDEMQSGWFPGHPEIPSEVYKWEQPEREAAYRIYYMVVEETAKARLRDFYMQSLRACIDAPHPVYYVFEYEDGAGSFQSHLEHGDVFAAFPHMRISKH